MGLSNFSIFSIFKAKDGVTPVFKSMTSSSMTASQKLKAGIDKANDALKSLKKYAVATTAAVTAVGTAAIAPYKVFSDWEKGLKNVYTLLSQDELAKYGETLKDLSKQGIAAGRGIDEVNSALFNAVSAMGMSEKTIDVYQKALVLSRGGSADLSTTLSGMMSVINAWGAETTDVTRVANAFFTAQKNGVTDVQQLASNIGAVAPMAKAMGLSFEDTAATIAALTKGGLSTDAAVTALRATLTALMHPAEGAAAALEEMGVPFEVSEIRSKGLTFALQKLIEAQKKNPDAVAEMIPNIRALTGVLAMDESKMQEVHKTLTMINEDVKNGTGLNEAFKMMESTSAVTWTKALGAYKNALIDIGEVVSPYIDKLLKALTEFAPVLTDLIVPAVKDVIKIASSLYHFINDHWISIISGVGGMLAVKKAFDIASGAVAWFRTSIMISTSQGIVAMSGFAKIKFILGGFTKSIWASVKAIWAQTTALLANPWTWVAVGIGLIVAGAILLWKNWDKVTETFQKWWEKISPVLSEFKNKCKDVFFKIGKWIKEHFIDILLIALGPVGWIIEAIRYLPKLLGAIKGESVKIGSSDKKDGKTPKPKHKQKDPKGKIGVEVELSNKTDKNAAVSTSLESSNNLELSAA